MVVSRMVGLSDGICWDIQYFITKTINEKKKKVNKQTKEKKLMDRLHDINN